MDAVSYSLASKQAQRIEKFIENPDSNSGVVTVPKVIASGETITIPAGRVAILPNVQIDGVLNVENGGEVFIPSGASLSKVVEKVTSTDNAIVRFNGTTGEVQNSCVVIDDNGTLLLTSGTGGLGYGTGSGGTVTQLTSKSTAVTLNKPTGQIIMNNAALAGQTIVSFQFNNSLLSSTDRVYIQPDYDNNASSYSVKVGLMQPDFCIVNIRNDSGSSLAEPIRLLFIILKGANS